MARTATGAIGEARAVVSVGRSVTASAPVRVADVGGWTDTWFGSPGQVCHLAVGPGVAVTARAIEGSQVRHGLDGEHPLLDAAIAAVSERTPLPVGIGVELEIASAVPPGASLGTSASVLVALIGALDGLLADRPLSAEEIAVLAHDVETVRAGRQAGVQDQWAAAWGGAALLAIAPYPTVRRRALIVPEPARAELGDRLVTVVFGPHDSSEVHAEVIDAIVGCSGEAHERARRALRSLESLAVEAADALEAGDLGAWGGVMTASVQAQRALHPALVGEAHGRAIEVARSVGASGWKVNGAGGSGGSLTILAARDDDLGAGGRVALETALRAADSTWTILHLRPSPGLQIDVTSP